MSDAQHPWLAGQSASEEVLLPVVQATHGMPRPTTPQPGVPAPDIADRLPRLAVNRLAAVWWLGAHGGAGESTLSHLLSDSRAAGHAWPIAHDGSQANVVLVARSNADGLQAAQRAAMEWASGSLPTINLLGLVIVADAPGKLPKPLRDLAQVVSGGVPNVWQVPWVEAWRLGEPVCFDSSPKDVRDLAAAISALVDSRTA